MRRRRKLNADSNILWSYSGFLVRRVWQIHVAMFMEEAEGTGVTPVQFSILLTLRQKEGLDQRRLAENVGIDRSNTADIMRRMQQAGLIKRSRGVEDRRAMIVSLTPKGARLIEALERRVDNSHRRLVEALSPAQRETFVGMLQRIVAVENDLGRARLKLG